MVTVHKGAGGVAEIAALGTGQQPLHVGKGHEGAVEGLQGSAYDQRAEQQAEPLSGVEQADHQEKQQAVGQAEHQILEGRSLIHSQSGQPLHRHPGLREQKQRKRGQGGLHDLAPAPPDTSA
ncbi:hypothetical protein FQZ97_707890 [compost metagenome]